jgi:1-deoxy-D-xylulose-5-phosphate reductoisomerase
LTIGLSLLGSTGSIGRSALTVVRQHPERIRVVALAAHGGRAELLLEQAREFHPQLVAVVEPAAAGWLAPRLPADCRLAVGREALLEAATWATADRVLAAMVGAAGLPAVHAAIDGGKTVALANKEALVVGGRLLPELARRRGVEILPVDSEHAALHQLLRAGNSQEVARLTLTASGGPFRLRPIETWDAIRPEDALRHPTWEMGAKITVDSATLMNKALEFIEARHLFDIAAERIDVVVHPRSIVHSLVEFVDGSVVAQLSPNDMVFPIQYALAYPERWANDFARLDLAGLGSLEFEPLDEQRFPAIQLARQALAAGDSAPAVLNAANEVGVAAFLAGEMPFRGIVALVRRTLDDHRPAPVSVLDDALAWDHWGRERARELHRQGVSS